MADNNNMSDLEMLEALRNRIYEAITKNEPLPKVGELLKIIEMKNKLTVAGKAEKKFWDMINTLREEKLGGKSKDKPNKDKRVGILKKKKADQ